MFQIVSEKRSASTQISNDPTFIWNIT